MADEDERGGTDVSDLVKNWSIINGRVVYGSETGGVSIRALPTPLSQNIIHINPERFTATMTPPAPPEYAYVDGFGWVPFERRGPR